MMGGPPYPEQIMLEALVKIATGVDYANRGRQYKVGKRPYSGVEAKEIAREALVRAGIPWGEVYERIKDNDKSD